MDSTNGCHVSDSHLHGSFIPVRLQGQEKLHFSKQLCTEYGYTGDDGMDECLLLRHKDLQVEDSQAFGYREMQCTESNKHKGIYTRSLGHCIGILAVALGLNRQVYKFALMHEDYSSPRGSVTSIYNQSFKAEMDKVSKIKFFLAGGNGGNKFTEDRFNIHTLEINSLKEEHPEKIELCFSAQCRDSTNDIYERNLTHLFYSFVDSSSYLWLLQDSEGQRTIETFCVSGLEIPNAALQEHLLL